MRKLVVVVTALAFLASFVAPALGAATGTTTGKTVTKPVVKTTAKTVAKPAAKSVKACPKMAKAKKMHKAALKGKKCVVKKKVSAVAKPGKGPCLPGYKAKKMGAKYHKFHKTHKMACWTSHKRMGAGPKMMMKKKWVSKRAYMCVPAKRTGAGPMRYHKHMKKAGKTCPRMPGQTY